LLQTSVVFQVRIAVSVFPQARVGNGVAIVIAGAGSQRPWRWVHQRSMPFRIRWFWTDAGDRGRRSVRHCHRLTALSAVAADIDCFPGPDRGQRLPTARIGNGVDDGDHRSGITKIRGVGWSKVHAVPHSDGFLDDAGNGGRRVSATVNRLAALSAVAADIDCFPGPDRGQRLARSPRW